MDEDQNLLEGEVGFDSGAEERDQEQRDQYESTRRNGGNGGCVFFANIRFEPFCHFAIGFGDVGFGGG